MVNWMQTQMDPIREHLFGPISGSSTGSAVSHLNGWDNMGAAKMADEDRHSAELEFLSTCGLAYMVLAGILDRTIAVISTTCFVSAHGAQSALYTGLMGKRSVQSREQRIVMLFNTKKHLIMHGQKRAAAHRHLPGHMTHQ